MERLRIADLKPSGTYKTELMIRDVTEKKDKNGRTYFVLKMTDGEGECDMFYWDSGADGFPLRAGTVVSVSVSVSLYNDKPSYSVRSCTPAADASVKDFIPSAPVDPEVLYGECLAAARAIPEEGLRTLTVAIYEDFREKLLWWGAAKSVHHSRPGELLWHVTRMMRMAHAVAAEYPAADEGLLVAGVLLHDIGKLHELSTSPIGITDYTVPGQLCGHAYLGADMIRSYGERLGTPAEDIRMLVHIILSHHGKPEYGAAAKPATIEAQIVHCLDLMDSHVYIFERELEKLEPGETGDAVYSLDGAKVYKPKTIL